MNSLFRVSGVDGDLISKALVSTARAGADEVLDLWVGEVDSLPDDEVDRRAGVEIGKQLVEVGN